MFAFALLLSAVPSSPPAPSEADLLLQQIDEKIIAAKGLRIDFTVNESTAGKDQRLTQGSLVIADHNRLYCQLTGPFTAKVVSDGKHMVSIVGDPPEKKSHSTPVWFNEFLQRSLGRGGTFVALSRSLDYAEKNADSDPTAEGGPQVANAKLLPAEEIDGTKTQVIEYELSWPKSGGEVDTVQAKVWIDPATKLPLRRTMIFPIGTEKKTFTAVHTKFELNPKVDDKLFELPK